MTGMARHSRHHLGASETTTLRGRKDRRRTLVRGMGKLAAVLGFAVLGVAPLMASAAPAGAQDPEYPPGTCRLALNVSVAERGQTVLASTVNCSSPYLGGVDIDLFLNSDPVFLTGTKSNRDGLFSGVAFTVPAQAPLGQHTVTSVGPGAEIPELVLSAPLTVVAPGGGGPAVDNGGGTQKADGGGGLAFTGSSTLPLLFLALVLLTIGTALVLAARRRSEVRRRVAN